VTGVLAPESFLAAARNALADPAPHRAMQALLEDMVAALKAKNGQWMEQDGDEVMLAASPDMTVYHIMLTPRIHYPPHDHRMPAMIGLYRGSETSFTYRRDGAALVRTHRHDYAAPRVAALPADVIHSVVNLGDARSAAIHVYFGDLGAAKRSVWNADLQGERNFDNRFYFEQARRM
jgi:predicted metal-dependent enzyme (double-stranded beta helix superfamily)